METNVKNKYKSFASIEQSRKLAEILPLESADFYYSASLSVNGKHWNKIPYIVGCKEDLNEYTFPCWSLAALLGVLPEYHLSSPNPLDKQYCCRVKDIETYSNNPVDACVSIIEKLHELNLL